MPSPDFLVMLHPATAFPTLAALPAGENRWMALRRPLFVAFVLGCTISLITSGRLTLRLLVPATIYSSCVPLFEIASLAAVYGSKRRLIPLPRAIGLFFMGHGPWSLWLIGFAATWAFVPAVQVYSWSATPWIWLSSALPAMAWSAYIDFCFFRTSFNVTPAQAVRHLLLQRLLCWVPALFLFFASAGCQVIASRLGL